MTGLHAAPLRRPESKVEEGRPVRRFLVPWGGAVAVAAGAWVIRAVGITTDYNIFVDETTYSRIADNLATGRGVTLYGAPFDLHPPAGFAIMAVAIRAFSMHGSLEMVLFDLRPFVALLGALTCGLVFVLVGRLTNWPLGLAAAAVIALDPFEIYYDSHVMLEAPAQLAAVASIGFLTASLDRTSQRSSWLLTACGGLAAGLALCIKENFGLVLAVTLLLAVALGWVLERAKAAFALVLMIGSYLLSQALLVLTSGFGPWWRQVGSGLSRLVGVEQTSGFNSAAVHVSLVSRVTADATHYGVTYLLLGLGAVAGGWQVINAVRHRAQWRCEATSVARAQLLVALWATVAVLYLAYSTGFGTLEEQLYYVLLVPGLSSLVIWCYRARPARLGKNWLKIFAAAVAVVLIADAAVWTAVHSTPDDEYRQLVAWVPRHLPAGTTVAVTEYTAQFLLHGVVLGQWATVPELVAHRVDYVLLSTALVSQGYGIGTPAFERYLDEHAKIAWEAKGPSSGDLILFDVQAITGAR
jgi:4-amino-4-deoxy-L-arabinose transferase-like glycosyltransferase